MHSFRIPVTLALLFLGMASQADNLHLGSPYNSCEMTLTENGMYRISCYGGLHPLLVIQTRAYDRYLKTKQDDFKITLFKGEITDAEAKTIFESAVDTLQHFRFDVPGDGVMDGSSVTLAIDSEGGNGMQVSIGPLKDPKDASPGIARIIAIADSHAEKDWEWSKKLPAQFATDVPARNRKPAHVAAIFKERAQPDIGYVLAALGRPDGFSKQMWQTKTKGTAATDNGGGTFLFLLDGGSELHVWTPDFKRVLLAIQYGPKGEEEQVYHTVSFH